MIQEELPEKRKPLRTAWFGVLAAVTALILFVTLAVFKPAGPARILLLTDSETSAYHELGLRYAEDLRRRGLEADVIVTGGALDNVRRLKSGEDAVAFAPSTIDLINAAGVDSSHLVALGSIGIEPHWLFYRSDLEISRIPDLAGRCVITEGEGTTSEHIARLLIDYNGLTNDVELKHLVELNTETILHGFSKETIAAVFLSGSSTSPLVKSMLEADGSGFLSFDRADAYAKRMPGVTAISAPEGVFDLGRNVPPQEARLLANATCLIAHEDLHPSVVTMLLVTAENVGQPSEMFSTKVTFPSSQHVTIPLDWAASRFFRHGEVGLSKFLPYPVTRFLNHLGFVVIPLLTAALIFLKAMPATLRIWAGLRLKRLLRLLERIEKRDAAGDNPAELLAELDRVDRLSNSMFVPLSTVHDYVDFRQFLHDMRDRVGTKNTTRP